MKRYYLRNRQTREVEKDLWFATYNDALHARGLHVQDIDGKHPFEIVDSWEE